MKRGGTVEYAIENTTCHIKIDGNLTFSNNAGFEKFTDFIIKNKHIEHVIIDLSTCEYMDSTNLGLLAAISVKKRKIKDSVAKIFVKDNRATLDMIKSIGFDSVFDILEEESDTNEKKFTFIKNEDSSNIEKIKSILLAHETLMNLNEKNRDIFKPVVDFIKKDISEGD